MLLLLVVARRSGSECPDCPEWPDRLERTDLTEPKPYVPRCCDGEKDDAGDWWLLLPLPAADTLPPLSSDAELDLEDSMPLALVSGPLISTPLAAHSIVAVPPPLRVAGPDDSVLVRRGRFMAPLGIAPPGRLPLDAPDDPD